MFSYRFLRYFLVIVFGLCATAQQAFACQMRSGMDFTLLREAEATLKVKILSYTLDNKLFSSPNLELRVLEVYRGPYRPSETVNVNWINSTFGHPKNLDEFVNKSGKFGGYGSEFYVALEKK